jgi:hypothetical protein
MKTAVTLLLLGMLLPVSSYAMQAGGPTMVGPEIRPGIPVSDGELTREVLIHVTRGDAFRSKLQFTDAAREYRSAVAIVRGQGHLPSRTMWLLANAYYNDKDFNQAAAVLDRLANEAARFGDLAVEALALFNAAWLKGQAGRGNEAAARVSRLEQLLRSPYMPVTVRDHLSGRLTTRGDVAVDH